MVPGESPTQVIERRCPWCDEVALRETRFCESCGADLTEPFLLVTPGVRPVFRGRRRGIKIALALLLILVFAMWIALDRPSFGAPLEASIAGARSMVVRSWRQFQEWSTLLVGRGE